MNRKIIYLAAILFITLFAVSCRDETPEVKEVQEPVQELQVDRRYRPLAHHFGSTGCSSCGRIGIPVMEALATEMADSVVPFITHFKYNDPFITSSSEAIEAGMLEQWSSPQFWLNSTNITSEILSSNIPAVTVAYKQRLRAAFSQSADAFVGARYVRKENMRYDFDVLIENVAASEQTFFVELYTIEDGLVASQAGANPYVATHKNVNRGGYYGDMGKEITLAAGAEFSDSFELIPCSGCATDGGLYFYVIVWQKTSSGKYAYVNGKVLK